jgi:rhodanese-related sulfurtransferase
MKQFTVEQLKEYLDAGNKPVILDVREVWEYEICHLENSKNISMSLIPARLEELDPEDETIVLCHHGMRSTQVATYLESQGFNNLINLVGGIDAWAKSVDASMPKY